MSATPSRHALLALAALIAAAAGVVVLEVRPPRAETCADPEALFSQERLEALAVPGFDLRRSKFERLEDESDDVEGRGRAPRPGRSRRAIEGMLIPRNPRDAEIAVAVRRTLQLPRWLVRPTTAVPGPAEPDLFERIDLDVDGERVIAQLAYGMRRGEQQLSAHVLGYGDRSITSSFWTRFFEAPRSIFEGVKPIVYIGAATTASPVDMPRQRGAILQFLEAAWRHYREACGP